MRTRRLPQIVIASVAGCALLASCGGSDETAPGSTDNVGSEDVEFEEIELTYSAPWPPGSALEASFTEWADAISERTDGQVTISPTFGGALFGPQDSLKGAGDGLVDLAASAPGYHPSATPLWQASGILFYGVNSEVDGRAMKDLAESNDAFAAEFEQQGVKLLHVYPASLNTFALKEPIEGIDDLAGLKIRYPGPYVDAAFEAVGATAVQVATGELFDALQRGTVDGSGAEQFSNYEAFGILDYTPYIYDGGLETYGMAGDFMNLDTWNNLPDNVKTVIDEESERFIDIAMAHYREVEDRMCKIVADDPDITLTILSDEEIERWHDATFDYLDLIEDWKSKALDTGLAEDEVDQLWDDYTAALDSYAAEVEPHGARGCDAAEQQ